ncbi:hypothetical protein G6F70_007372 [Rhizopus microsporus]|nr:hypothetical protein G6F71_007364 [Rhizopus microsporus]KAG1196537.1 hypothetical protein G6F70_007372 [Rhizopus microsporus]KAG1210435.1 hypothetical protein G6F69_005483 [Rhizopus microsporus]KAG1229600.1 hypothetical protein G6F67_007036 [Rhizopus microsporus]KAG1264185.1 hypothetical protein G6F68_004555 [Rhizopus microsporus]
MANSYRYKFTTRLSLIASAALSVFGLTQALDQHAAQPACREKYTVTKGDTCQSIASKHHVTKGHLAEWTKKLEPSFDCDKIKPGQRDAHEYRHPAHNKFHPREPTTTHIPPKPIHAPKESEHKKRKKPAKKHTTKAKPAKPARN